MDPGEGKKRSAGWLTTSVLVHMQDFEEKKRRGGGAGVTRPNDYQRKLDRSCTDTCFDAALQYARMCR